MVELVTGAGELVLQALFSCETILDEIYQMLVNSAGFLQTVISS